jgi:hypothetical protein
MTPQYCAHFLSNYPFFSLRQAVFFQNFGNLSAHFLHVLHEFYIRFVNAE